QGGGPESHFANIDTTFQKRAGKSSRDRETTRRDQHSRRQRPKSSRPGTRECAAYQRDDGRACVGRHLRSQAHWHFCGRERDRKSDCRNIAGKVDRCGEKLDCESADRESGSVRTLSQRPILLEQANWRGSSQSDRLFQSSDCQRSELRPGLRRPGRFLSASFLIRCCFSRGIASASKISPEKSARARRFIGRSPRFFWVAGYP